MLKKIFQKMFYFITQPEKSWASAANEEMEMERFLANFLYPILGVITLAAFVGTYWSTKVIETALKVSIGEFVAFFAGFYLASFLLKEVMSRYFVKTPMKQCQHFVVYASSLVYFVSMAASLFNGLGLLYLFLPYTIYMVWEGAEPFMKIEEDKQIKFTAMASIVLIAPYLVKFIINKFMLT